MTAAGLRVVVGVCGGIAAYKAAHVVRLFTEAGASVTVVPTESALRFVGAPTWEALSGNPVSTTVWEQVPQVNHVMLGQTADLVVVAPATANLLAKAAAGIADDLLTTTLLAAHGPVVMAPAMHTEMWQHAATAANVATLRARGVTVIDPAEGRLTGSDSGPGRLPEPQDIVDRSLAVARPSRDLAGRHVLISAGGTREPIDPVRFLGNRSSGRQGFALASTAVSRGADVTVIAANVGLPRPAGVTVVDVETAAQLHVEMLARQSAADIIAMVAAVADFRPAVTSDVKIKKGSAAEPTQLQLERTPDILAELVQHRPAGQVIVGFAAETGDAGGDVLAHARTKLAAKGCDLLVVNDVSGGAVFGGTENAVVILAPHAQPVIIPQSGKDVVAAAVWDTVVATQLSS